MTITISETALDDAVIVGDFVILSFGLTRRVVTLVGLKEMIHVGLNPNSLDDVASYLNEWGDGGVTWLRDRNLGELRRWKDGERMRKEQFTHNFIAAAEDLRAIGTDPFTIL